MLSFNKVLLINFILKYSRICKLGKALLCLSTNINCRISKIFFSLLNSFRHIEAADFNVQYEPRQEKTRFFAEVKTKALISFVVTAQLISAFVFATQTVQLLLPPLLKSKISSIQPSSVAAQAGLCQTWSETLKTFFLLKSIIINLRVLRDYDWKLRTCRASNQSKLLVRNVMKYGHYETLMEYLLRNIMYSWF